MCLSHSRTLEVNLWASVLCSSSEKSRVEFRAGETFLSQLGQTEQARVSFAQALALTSQAQQRRFPEKRLAELESEFLKGMSKCNRAVRLICEDGSGRPEGVKERNREIRVPSLLGRKEVRSADRSRTQCVHGRVFRL